MLFKTTQTLHIGIAMAMALVATSSVAQYTTPKMEGRGGRVIIKSVDARGHVVYSDHPVEGVNELQTMHGRVFMNIPRPASAASAQAVSRPAAKAASGAGGIEAWATATQAQLDASKKAVNDANDKIAKQNCDGARQTLATLVAGRRIVKVNASGTPEVLSAETVAAEREKTEARIAQNCK